MIVQTMQRQYAVLQVLHSDAREESSLCKDLETDQLCLLVRFRDAADCRRMLPLMAAQRSNRSFEDYQGLFTQNGELYLHFRYTQAPLLKKRLEKGDLLFRERLELTRDLLERMTLLDMPPILQYEALRECNVTVDEALRARFNYVLQSLDKGDNVDMTFICVRVSEWLKMIFAQELEAESVPEVSGLRKRLDQGEFASYLEIYRAYDEVRKVLLQRTAQGPAEPRTWLFRLWDRIKGWSRLVKPILVGLVLVASFCYLLYTLLVPSLPSGTPVRFDRIGTVEIQHTRDFGS